MSLDPSRKQFFGKLLGLCAGVSVVPKILARNTARSGALTEDAQVSFILRPEARSVARRVDSL